MYFNVTVLATWFLIYPYYDIFYMNKNKVVIEKRFFTFILYDTRKKMPDLAALAHNLVYQSHNSVLLAIYFQSEM